MANDTSTMPPSKVQDGNQAGDSSLAGHVVDQIRDHVGDAADKLKGVGADASSTLDDLKGKTSDVLESVKSMAADAGTKATDALETQKSAGSDRAKSFSDALRRAAGELEQDIPPAATYIKRAADEIDHMADAVKRRDIRQILGDVQDFAKRQPAAFLGATVLGGFALVRLLKTPTASQASPGASTSQDAPPAARATALVASSSFGTKPITGGAGDPGGVSPQAPGFDFKPTEPSTGGRK